MTYAICFFVGFIFSQAYEFDEQLDEVSRGGYLSKGIILSIRVIGSNSMQVWNLFKINRKRKCQSMLSMSSRQLL